MRELGREYPEQESKAWSSDRAYSMYSSQGYAIKQGDLSLWKLFSMSWDLMGFSLNKCRVYRLCGSGLGFGVRNVEGLGYPNVSMTLC